MLGYRTPLDGGSSWRMDFDFWGSNGLAVGSAFLVPLGVLLISSAARYSASSLSAWSSRLAVVRLAIFWRSEASRSLRSDRPSHSFGGYVATDPSRTRSLCSHRTVSDIDQQCEFRFPQSMSLTLEGVVPTVWLGSIVALRKLRTIS
ncbi:hypothetical protein F2Q70_00042282 [Brassica cretica]|uniref:Uncharacterized protein n=1 Tax=Brassica cretica TaxID=69181 RepID=A0A8S9KCL4_BRACR|nr:hypothetical protein F2Q70_00042282 [Brassica cretica]